MDRSKTMPEGDVVDLLVHQHSQIRDLFDKVENTLGDERKEAFGRLVRLLAVHETAEEEIIHPLARRALPGGEEIVDDRLEEERSAKEKLARLENMDPETPRFLRRSRRGRRRSRTRPHPGSPRLTHQDPRHRTAAGVSGTNSTVSSANNGMF